MTGGGIAMRHSALVAALLLLVPAHALAGDGPVAAAAGMSVPMEPPGAPFARDHRGYGFSLEIPGPVEHEQIWPQVHNPRKFTLHAVFPAGRTFVYLFVFDLADRDADWWLSEVVGFLFESENLVSAGITEQGYDYYLLEMPGGGGAPPFTEALIMPPGGLAFRLTCQDCHRQSASAELDRMIDSLLVFSLPAASQVTEGEEE